MYKIGTIRILVFLAYSNSAAGVDNFIPLADCPSRLQLAQGPVFSYGSKAVIIATIGGTIAGNPRRLGFVNLNGQDIVPNNVRGTLIWSTN